MGGVTSGLKIWNWPRFSQWGGQPADLISIILQKPKFSELSEPPSRPTHEDLFLLLPLLRKANNRKQCEENYTRYQTVNMNLSLRRSSRWKRNTYSEQNNAFAHWLIRLKKKNAKISEIYFNLKCHCGKKITGLSHYVRTFIFNIRCQIPFSQCGTLSWK